MKKITIILFTLLFSLFTLTAQSDDDLFGGSDDDFFGDDGIEVVEEVSAKSDLSKGTIFDAGSVKIGGRFDSSIQTSTVLYADDDQDFSDHLKDTTLSPTLSAFLTVDARPTDILRMYTKFGFAYPFETTAKTTATETTVFDYFKVKEAFTDFSYADRAFFRFGLHTVTWGTGYFFSPVSDIINASSIDPENTDAQVDGVLNLRTQVTFPGTQNCLWTYVIPSSSFKAIDTAFAAKGEFLIGGWEFGLGGYYKYENAPKAVLTASGSLKKCTIFGEFVYQYGGASEWAANTDWDDKENIIQATAGLSYMFKDPQIMLAGQYYYDGNCKDSLNNFMKSKNFTYGHNFAVMANFGKILDNTDWTATLFGNVNIRDNDDYTPMEQYMLEQAGMGDAMAVFFGKLNYTPFKNCTIGAGPYVVLTSFEKAPTVSFNLTATLGGGKF